MTTPVGELYRQTRTRIVELISDSDAAGIAVRVPACPAWTVRDLLGHVTAVAEDVLAGRIPPPPTDADTAAQVERHHDLTVDDLLDKWAKTVRPWELGDDTTETRPPMLDIVSHEHDIRGALGRPGARDDEAVLLVSDQLLRFDPPVPLTIELEDAVVNVGPSDGDELRLKTTRWEVLRFRMGRRSKRQMASMDWSGDPSRVLDHLTRFGPARVDLVE